jgi:hypothetical protein
MVLRCDGDNENHQQDCEPPEGVNGFNSHARQYGSIIRGLCRHSLSPSRKREVRFPKGLEESKKKQSTLTGEEQSAESSPGLLQQEHLG